jgi:hypothetical protein
MTFDPTTNRIPFDLLTKDEQAALKAWPHGYEHFGRWLNGWHLCDSPEWAAVAVYRGLPKPVVTSVWHNVYSDGPKVRGMSTRKYVDDFANGERIAVLRIDLCNGVSTAHLEDV